MEVLLMIELTNEQKLQILENRRMIVARNAFEVEVDIVVMTAQGRKDEVDILSNRIAELRATDVALQEFIKTI